MSLPKPSKTNIVESVPTTFYDLVDYYKSWPMTEGTRCVTKGRRNTYEIKLDHVRKLFSYTHTNGFTVTDSTPTGILHKMALEFYILPLSSARSNWSNMWFTRNDGHTYVVGIKLRQECARFHGKQLYKRIRYDVPHE